MGSLSNIPEDTLSKMLQHLSVYDKSSLQRTSREMYSMVKKSDYSQLTKFENNTEKAYLSMKVAKMTLSLKDISYDRYGQSHKQMGNLKSDGTKDYTKEYYFCFTSTDKVSVGILMNVVNNTIRITIFQKNGMSVVKSVNKIPYYTIEKIYKALGKILKKENVFIVARYNKVADIIHVDFIQRDPKKTKMSRFRIKAVHKHSAMVS